MRPVAEMSVEMMKRRRREQITGGRQKRGRGRLMQIEMLGGGEVGWNVGGGDRNGSFCFFKQDERQEQQNNLTDENHSNTDRGEERRGEERRGEERRGEGKRPK